MNTPNAFSIETASLGRPDFHADRKPIILTFVPHYLPGYKCGPIQSVSSLVEMSGGLFDFLIITSDCDAGDHEPYPGVEAGAWHDVGKAKVLYLSKSQLGVREIREIMNTTPHDAVYLNSFFDVDFTIKPLLVRRFGRGPNKPVLVAPRGELSTVALKLKNWKKRSFLLVARAIRLYRGLIWHASSTLEKSEIENVVTPKRVFVAPNLVRSNKSELTECLRAESKPLRICFLSRISEMKNLEFAIEVLKGVSCPVDFSIFGPIGDAAYWTRCQRQIEELPSHIRAFYGGAIEHGLVPPLMSRHDLFFLPTRGENFGHAIYESLAAGTPVLISDRTPWRDLEESGSGWDLPLDDVKGFRRAIESAAVMDQVKQSAMRLAARSLAERYWSDKGIVAASLRLFDEVLRDPGAPRDKL